MDISQLLNPATPPASPGNNAGISGNGGAGGGNGGNSGLHPLAGHGNNQSDDNNTEDNGPSVPASTFPYYNPDGGNQPHATDIANILDQVRINRGHDRLTRPMLSRDHHILLEGFLKHNMPQAHHTAYVDTSFRKPNAKPDYGSIRNNTALTQALRNVS